MIFLRRATYGWLKLVLAPSIVCMLITLAILAFAICLLSMHYLFWRAWAQQLFDYSEALAGFCASLSVLAGYYGLMRALVFHPALDYRYHEWLKATPWEPGHPLPKGPLTPVWQDGVVLTTLTVVNAFYAPLTERPEGTALGPSLCMAAGMTLGWTAANLVTRNLLAVYAVLLTFPAVGLLLIDRGLTGIAIALVTTAVVAYSGVVRGMKGYPWLVFARDKRYLSRITNPDNERRVNWQLQAAAGWPYMQMLEPPEDIRVPRWRAGMEALIAGAWVAYFGCLAPPAAEPMLIYFTAQIGCGLVIAKLFMNLLLMCPKLCLGERIAKRRPILWRHDRLILEPLLVALVMFSILGGWYLMDLEPLWVGAILMLMSGVWLTRRLGRPVEDAFYTGSQSIRGMVPNRAYFEPLAAPGE
ncbi:hypothetical protein MalM25_32720 [Planctomycetes bacterium MalM25]|nr:hypothetical protein MalM25_32720 [Planctomycetes bacterium MalM25]